MHILLHWKEQINVLAVIYFIYIYFCRLLLEWNHISAPCRWKWMKGGIKSNWISLILPGEPMEQTMWRHCEFRFMQTAAWGGYIFRTACTQKRNFLRNLSCTFQCSRWWSNLKPKDAALVFLCLLMWWSHLILIMFLLQKAWGDLINEGFQNVRSWNVSSYLLDYIICWYQFIKRVYQFL